METLARYSHRKQPFYFSFHTRSLWVLRDALSPSQSEYRREKEHIIAELCVDLIDRCGWQLANIHIGELVPVVSQEGWSYPEVDVLLTDGSGRPSTLIKVAPREQYGAAMAESLQELFLLAHAIHLDRSPAPLWLVYCTRWHEPDASIREQVVTIDYARFQTFAAWDHAGRPSGDAMPHRDGNRQISR